MYSNETYRKEFRKSVILAVIFLIFTPIVLLFLAYFIRRPGEISLSEETTIITYIMLIMGIAGPAVYQILKRFQMRDYRKGKMSAMTPGQFYVMSSTVKYALVESIFIYGFIVFILSQDIFKLLLFYIIGIAWSYLYFPSWNKMEKFLKEVEGK